MIRDLRHALRGVQVVRNMLAENARTVRLERSVSPEARLATSAQRILRLVPRRTRAQTAPLALVRPLSVTLSFSLHLCFTNA